MRAKAGERATTGDAAELDELLEDEEEEKELEDAAASEAASEMPLLPRPK